MKLLIPSSNMWLSKDSFHEHTVISRPRIRRELICSADGAGQQVWVVDDVDEDSLDFIHGVAVRSVQGYTSASL